MLYRNITILLLFIFPLKAWCQPQDVDFHLSAHLLNGQKIIKVKRDFNDVYLWALGTNNTVYRVNSITLAVDDYTAKFAQYNNLQFADILARSADTVFIAANTPDVIELAKSTLIDIGSSDGIPGNVNSLGTDLGWNSGNVSGRFDILIATDNGVRTFNVKKQTIGFLPDVAPWAEDSATADSRVFESTYRTETYKDSTNGDASGWETPALHYMPVMYNTNEMSNLTGPYVCSYIWEGNSTFGKKVNTVFSLNVAEGPNNYGYFASYFWGSETGMFQTQANSSYNIYASSYSQYLNGIKVNKITDIYGLTAFSNYYSSPMVKQNLLIGTDNGFYFSSNEYDPYGFYPFKFALFHDDELGNTVINDICVNFVPDAQPICENGVWLAANDGLYLLKPDYAKYLNNQQQKFISFSNQPDTLSQMQVCSLSQVTAQVTGGSYNNIQWYKDGAELPGQSNSALTITAAGDYNAVIYDPCEAIHIESNHLKVTLISAPVFTFNYPDKIQQCDNTPLTLQTTYSPSYNYRWYTNGVLNDNTTSSFTVTQSGKYKVEVSACTNPWVPSKVVEVDLVNLPVPQVTADKAVYCAEDVAALTEDQPTDPSYTINWYRDGTLLTADNNLTKINETTPGSYTVTLASTIASCTQSSAALPLAFTPAPVFTFNYPAQLQYCAGTPLTLQATGSANYQYRWYKDGTLNGVVTPSLPVTANGTYKVEVSSCAGSWIGSQDVQVAFIQVATPVIKTDKTDYCIGDNANLSLTKAADPDYTINWYKDNVLLPANTNQGSIITNVPGSYTVALVNSITNSDGTVCSQKSTAQAISFNPLPTVSIEKIVNTTICEGQTIGLLAHYNGGTVQWSTGETTDQVSVTQPGTYTVTATSSSGCQAISSIDIAFLPNPVFSINDTSVCTYKKQVVTLTAPAGFAQYAWNGQTGGQTYQVSKPQTVSLTVTDINGCQATQQIKVADQCPNIYIPNTFTPNGDGINDTWVIEGLDGDPTATVKVFTRNGALVFDSIGYGTPWNGEYNGKKLPTGAYYYIVMAKNGSQKFSGSLTIIY